MNVADFRRWLRATIRELRHPVLDEEPQDALDMSAWAVDTAAGHAADLGRADLYEARPGGQLWPPDAIAYLSRCLAAIAPAKSGARPRYLTPPQAAKLLGVRRDTVLGWIRAGDLTAMNLARPGAARPRYRIGADDFERFRKSREVHRTPVSPRREKWTPPKRYY